MVNKVLIAGRLTRAIELKKTPTGVSVATFTIACNRLKTANNQNPETDFITCIAWRHTADFLFSYAKKGSLLFVEGQIQTRSYEKDNKKHYVVEVNCQSVQLLAQPKESDNNTHGDVQKTVSEEFLQSCGIEISSDDLPF